MTPEQEAKLDSAWKRLRAANFDRNAYQMTGTCVACGNPCWDHLPYCAPCDEKTVGAVITPLIGTTFLVQTEDGRTYTIDSEKD